jgi:hypothetical protein
VSFGWDMQLKTLNCKFVEHIHFLKNTNKRLP